MYVFIFDRIIATGNSFKVKNSLKWETVEGFTKNFPWDANHKVQIFEIFWFSTINSSDF